MVSWEIFSTVVGGLATIGGWLFRRERNRLDNRIDENETQIAKVSSTQAEMEQDLYGSEYSDGGRTREYDERLERIEDNLSELTDEVKANSRVMAFIAERIDDDVEDGEFKFRDTHREQYNDE